MRSKIFICFVEAFFVAAVAVGASATLNGVVSGPDGQPIENAAVNAYSVSFQIEDGKYDIHHAGQTTSNANGRFSLSPTPSGGSGRKTTLLFAEKEGLSIAFAYVIRPEADIHLEMTAPRTLSGRVEDARGAAVADALVRLPMLTVPFEELTGETTQFPMTMGLEPMPYFTTRTDGEGRFEFTTLPENCTAEILVKKPGLAPFQSGMGVGGPQYGFTYTVNQKDILLTLLDPVTLTGVVTGPDGQPVGNVKVALRESDTFYSLTYAPVQTDADGVFRFADVAPGSVTLNVIDPNWLSEQITVDVEADMHVSLKISKGTPLIVTVVDGVTEKPIEDAQVQIHVQQQRTMPRVMPHIGITNQDGVFEKRLAPGSYQIAAYTSGYRGRQPETITITDGQPVALTIALDAPARITGTVAGPSGKPMAGTEVFTLPGRGRTTTAVTGNNGDFVLAWEPEMYQRTPGEIYIVAIHHNENLAVAENIREDTTEIHLTLQSGLTVSGKVADPNGNPIENAEVRVMFRGPRVSPSINQSGQQHKTDADGRYTISALPPEQQYIVHIVGPGGYGADSVNLDESLEKNRLITVPQITLKRANLTVSGVVVDEDGNPVAGVRITMHGSGQPSGHTATDEDGRFTFDHVCEGPLQISAWHRIADEHLHANVQTEGGTRNVTLILAPPRTSTPRPALRHPVSLLGKPLPDLSAYGLEPTEEPSPTLVCVWDWQQHLSRNLVRWLARWDDALAGRSVRVVLLNAEPAERSPLDAWLAEYDIPFPCGIINEDSEAAQLALGIRALPWMILTHTDGTVIGEGVELPVLLQKQYAEKVRKTQTAQPDSKAAIVAGMALPNIEFHDLNGKFVSTDTLKGKVVLINFWATWCGPCIAETPTLLSIYEEFREQGLEIIGISLDSDRQALNAYIEKNKVTWPNYFDGKRWNNKIASRFGIGGVPHIVLLDREGIVKETNLRGNNIRSAVAELFNRPKSAPSAVNPEDWEQEYTVELNVVEDVTVPPYGVTWFRPHNVHAISTEKPDFITSLPDFKYEMQLYLTLKFGDADDNNIYAVMDFRKPERKFFPFDLYLDRNRNGDLSNEFIADPKRIMGVHVPYKDGTTDKNYSLHIYAYSDGEHIDVAYRTRAGRYGVFYAGQTPVQFLVLDYNANGVFNDRRDLILMDWNLDGQFDGRHNANPGTIALYAPLVLPDVTYQITECDPAGKWIKFQKVEQPSSSD